MNHRKVDYNHLTYNANGVEETWTQKVRIKPWLRVKIKLF